MLNAEMLMSLPPDDGLLGMIELVFGDQPGLRSVITFFCIFCRHARPVTPLKFLTKKNKSIIVKRLDWKQNFSERLFPPPHFPYFLRKATCFAIFY